MVTSLTQHEIHILDVLGTKGQLGVRGVYMISSIVGKETLVPYKVEARFILTSIHYINLGFLVLSLESNSLK